MKYIQKTTKKGFALSIVLWIVAALLFGIATLSVLSKDTIHLSGDLNQKLKTQLIAEDVFEGFKFYEMTANYDNISLKNSALNDFKYKFPKHIIVDGRWYSISKDINISITDTSKLINAQAFNPDYIAYSLTNQDQRQLRYEIVDSIKDWKDKDNIVSLNGAESSKYEFQKGVKYKIRNTPAVQSVAELRLINGIDSISQKKWNNLKNKFYYGDASNVNLALLNSEDLGNVLKLNKIEANIFIKLRAKDLNKFIRNISILKTFNDEAMGFYLAKQYKIVIKVKSKKTDSILTTIINFKKRYKNREYIVISYKII